MKKFIALFLSALMMLSLVACGNNAGNNGGGSNNGGNGGNTGDGGSSEGGEYVIGCPQPLTGTNAQPGECALYAVELAAKQINEAGGILGKQIHIVSYDDQGSPE